MTAAELAAGYGIRVEIGDLGAWGGAELNAEYDPEGPVIRINVRSVEKRAEADRPAFIALAIGHELYHHRERLGEVARLRDSAHRERAADAYARALQMETS